MAVLRTARIAYGKITEPASVRRTTRISGDPIASPRLDAPVYTCPAGLRVVIRCIDFWAEGDSQWPALGPETSYAWIEAPAVEYAIIFAADTITRGTYAHYEGQAVMDAGDVLVVATLQTSLSYQITGAKMPLPS